MIRSMTGYAQATRETPRGALTLEIKSVNSRFLDLAFRLNDELRGAEPLLREAITAQTVRGKVDCRLSFANQSNAPVALALNLGLVSELAKLNAQVKVHVPGAQDLRVSEILHWPGVMAEGDLPPDTLQTLVCELAQATVGEFIAARAREGARLTEMLESRLSAIEGHIKHIEPHVPAVVAAYNAKLVAKLQETITQAGGTLDGDRIRQEVALHAIKIDVAEELTRLSGHLVEVRRVLRGEGKAASTSGVGKRLDFLMQELHREANTLGSKSVSPEVGQAALEIKILIEQMREQVQNIE